MTECLTHGSKFTRHRNVKVPNEECFSHSLAPREKESKTLATDVAQELKASAKIYSLANLNEWQMPSSS